MTNLTCHVHIGMPKTGTTSIQNTLSRNDLGRLHFLQLSNDNHSPYFVNLFENAPWKHQSNVTRGRGPEEVIKRKKAIRRRLSKSMDEIAASGTADGIIFSGERLGTAGRCNAVAMGRFRDYFREWCQDFQIYGYVRPLASLMPSDFQQRLQTIGPAPFDLDWIYPHYTERFQKHDIVFGRPYVSLRRFVRDDLKDGDVVADIVSQLGIDLVADKYVRSNETLSLEAIALLFAARKGGLFQGSDLETSLSLNATSTLLKKFKGGKFHFDAALMDDLMERNFVDIRWIEHRIGASVSDNPKTDGRAIRHAKDLIDVAMESRHVLDVLSEIKDQVPNAVDPKIVLAHVEAGAMEFAG